MLNPELSLNRRLPDRIARNGALASLAERYQPLIRSLRDAGGAPVKNLLNGTVLGHPLHPVITDIPVGAWSVTALLDVLEMTGREDVAFAADAALGFGLLGGVGAIVTGYADWADTDKEPRTLGMAHAALNASAFGAYCGSLLLRRSGRRRAGIALSMLGYGISGFAAYLGGELAYNFLLGTKHTAEPLEPPQTFVPVLADDELPIGQMRRVDAAGIPVLLLRTHDALHAMSAVCTHRGAPLDRGTLEDGTCVRCPWHGSVFSFEDGSVIEGPATYPQARFEARVSDGRIEVRSLV